MVPDGLSANTPRKTLESWKQIAAYLDRSERTVRRWEAAEGLPVHRRGHQKCDTVFAFKHEIEAWTRRRTRFRIEDAPLAPLEPAPSPSESSSNRYLAEHDAITRVLDRYVAGARAGDGDLMRPSFHREATISGFCQGVEYSGSIEHVFAWVTANGPAPNLQPRVARIEIIETIALVHLDVRGWSGKLAGAASRASDVFTLLNIDGEWRITHKLFHWHTN